VFEHRPSWRISVGPKVIAARATLRSIQLTIFFPSEWSSCDCRRRPGGRVNFVGYFSTALTHSSKIGRVVCCCSDTFYACACCPVTVKKPRVLFSVIYASIRVRTNFFEIILFNIIVRLDREILYIYICVKY